jgi:hypothetical protein
MGKRFAVVIGVAAAGVMALGAQTTTAAPRCFKYDTKLTITTDRGDYHGEVLSDRDGNTGSGRAACDPGYDPAYPFNPGYDPANPARECMEGRRVVLLKRRSGADRKLGTARSDFSPRHGVGEWGMPRMPHGGGRVYAKVTPKVRDRFVCRADLAHLDDPPVEITPTFVKNPRD